MNIYLVIGALLYAAAMWFLVKGINKNSLTFIFLVWSALSVVGILAYAKVYSDRPIRTSVLVGSALILLAVIMLCYDQFKN